MPRPKRTKPTTRLTLDLSDEVRARLDRLKNQTGADSLTEVIRRALAVYDFCHRQKVDGMTVYVAGGGVEKEVVLL